MLLGDVITADKGSRDDDTCICHFSTVPTLACSPPPFLTSPLPAASAPLVSKAQQRPKQIRSMSDFARHVGLSRSAISRVLNNQGGLRKSTIDRVHKAMQETGFTVNVHALHLRGKSPSMIGICIENLSTPSDVGKLSALQERLEAKGYSSLIEVVQTGSISKVVRHFLSLRVDGIVFIGQFNGPELAEHIEQLARLEVAHLIVDQPGVRTANTVTLDRILALRQLMDHLLDLGHRRFGLLGVSGNYQTIADRLQGIREALEARGLDIASCVKSLDYLHTRTSHFDYGALLARSFASMPERPTAFIAVNDETAVGALLEFQAQGLRVPEDLSITGFNNQPFCLMTRPCLTSIDQQIDASMGAAADIILAQLGKDKSSARVYQRIAPQLVLRESTGPAPNLTSGF